MGPPGRRQPRGDGASRMHDTIIASTRQQDVGGVADMSPGAPGSRKEEDMGRRSVLPAGAAAASMEADPLSAALSRIAHVVSETLELKEVFARVAEAAANVLPFDAMGVSLFETPETMRLYAVAGDFVPEEPAHAVRLSDFSPALRPQITSSGLIADAVHHLDPAFPMDRRILDRGVRSVLRVNLFRGGIPSGTLWFTSAKPGVFTADHEAAARPIADLVSLALEHERLWSLEGARRRRLDAIDSLLPTLAGSLDVRGIFNRVSDIVQQVLPHDRLVLTSLSEDRSEIHVDVVSGEPIPDLPTRMPVAEVPTYQPTTDYVLIPDVDEPSESAPNPRAKCRQLGMRSL